MIDIPSAIHQKTIIRHNIEICRVRNGFHRCSIIKSIIPTNPYYKTHLCLPPLFTFNNKVAIYERIVSCYVHIILYTHNHLLYTGSQLHCHMTFIHVHTHLLIKFNTQHCECGIHIETKFYIVQFHAGFVPRYIEFLLRLSFRIKFKVSIEKQEEEEE